MGKKTKRGREVGNSEDGEEEMNVLNASDASNDFIESSVVDSEAVMEGDVNVVNGKKDRKKKRKAEVDADEEESEKAGKKRKKVLDGDDLGENEEASEGIAVDVVENLILENGDKKKKKKKKKKDEVDAIESSDAIDDDNKEADEDKKKRKKEKKNKVEVDAAGSDCATDDGNEEADEGKKKKKNKDEIDAIGSDCATDDGNQEADEGKKKKKNKDEIDAIGSDSATDYGNEEADEGKKKNKDEIDAIGSDSATDYGNEEADEGKKKKKNKDEIDAIGSDSATDYGNEEADEGKKKNKDEIDAMGSDSATGDGSEEAEKDKKKKKKKKKKKPESGGDNLEVKAYNKGVEASSSKKVRFADQVEVFPASDDQNLENENKKEELVRGKRFSKEEDEILEAAVKNYIDVRGLGEEGLGKVLYSKSHPEVKNCWKEIGASLPWRHTSSVYHRAHILFERDENRKWTPEEYETIKKYVEKRGNKWKALAGELGKHRIHVKDAWRRSKLENKKRGRWSQDEYQSLFDLVNVDLCMKATEEKKSKHGMLRDNICWGAISDKMTTRAFASCCSQWYYKLASPMVAEGKWADADDYRMLDALSNLDASCMEDVDWDELLEHRSGDVCRKRWSQMVQHIGHHGSQSFPEQVETLANRYRPDMLEARETFDAKPYADLAE